MKLKTIIIDDEPLASMLLEGYVAKTPFLHHIATFSTAVEAMDSEELKQADIMLLDIQMPTLTGLEFSRMVSSSTRIIFTTAFNQYALDGYKVNALDYLLKPIAYVDFLAAAQKGLEWFQLKHQASHNEQTLEQTSQTTSQISPQQTQQADSIFVKSEYKLHKIEFSKLLYVEGLKDYVKFVIEGEQKPILSLMNLKKIEEILPSEQFIRVHRSFIVRLEQIKVIERGRIVVGSDVVPIGENFKAAVQEFLQKRTI